MNEPLYLTFLWHMHQPYYRNIETDKFILPWVRMHAVKDYYDMVAILDKYPDIKQNFNLVPSLLLQIEEYLNGVTDIFMDMTLKPASELNDDEKVFIIFNFFMANWNTMVYPYRRYAGLLAKRGENTDPDMVRSRLKDFSEQDMRDLQVWFNLAWIDPDFFGMFPELAAIKAKGAGFTEQEKKAVMDCHMKIMAMIIPKYAEAWKAGRIELSTTPFYHPILPLLCDASVSKQCMPAMPPLDFSFAAPEDAEAQVKKALDYFERKFGKRPEGMWPSEGSVSEKVLSILADQGVKWAATDEEILKHSLMLDGKEVNHGAIYRPYTYDTGAGKVDMVFRNLRLSDLIGFTYQSWGHVEAVDHFMSELGHIKHSLGRGRHAVNIILDGENAWEYYQNDGKDFLNELFSRLSKSKEFRTETISGLNRVFEGKHGKLGKIYPGSWINHDFYIWIGHEDDRKSWKLLKQAREDLLDFERQNPDKNEAITAAREALYTAEGSDWNWWYGDDHSSRNDAEFDNLYRLHLMNVYRLTGMSVPDALYIPISTASHAFEMLPTRFISPEIDGRDTSFYEWRGAGLIDLERESGAMHKSEKNASRVHYGFDTHNLFVRLDYNKTPSKITLKMLGGEGAEALINVVPDGTVETKGLERDGITAGCAECAEIKIPFSAVNGFADQDELRFIIFADDERVPDRGAVRVKMPDKDFELFNWKA